MQISRGNAMTANCPFGLQSEVRVLVASSSRKSSLQSTPEAPPSNTLPRRPHPALLPSRVQSIHAPPPFHQTRPGAVRSVRGCYHYGAPLLDGKIVVSMRALRKDPAILFPRRRNVRSPEGWRRRRRTKFRFGARTKVWLGWTNGWRWVWRMSAVATAEGV